MASKFASIDEGDEENEESSPVKGATSDHSDIDWNLDSELDAGLSLIDRNNNNDDDVNMESDQDQDNQDENNEDEDDQDEEHDQEQQDEEYPDGEGQYQEEEEEEVGISKDQEDAAGATEEEEDQNQNHDQTKSGSESELEQEQAMKMKIGMREIEDSSMEIMNDIDQLEELSLLERLGRDKTDRDKEKEKEGSSEGEKERRRILEDRIKGLVVEDQDNESEIEKEQYVQKTEKPARKDIRTKIKSPDSKPKQFSFSPRNPQKTHNTFQNSFRLGTAVMVRQADSNQWRKGKIVGINRNLYDVSYDDKGESLDISPEDLILVPGVPDASSMDDSDSHDLKSSTRGPKKPDTKKRARNTKDSDLEEKKNSTTKRTKSPANSRPSPKTQTPVEPNFKFKKAEQVEVRREGKKLWRMAVIAKVHDKTENETEMYDVVYSDRVKETNVPVGLIRSLLESHGDEGDSYLLKEGFWEEKEKSPKPRKDRNLPLKQKYALGEEVEIRFSGGRMWYGGKIKKYHNDKNCDFLGTYDVVYDDGDVEQYVEEDLIRTPVKEEYNPETRGKVTSQDIKKDLELEHNVNQKVKQYQFSLGIKVLCNYKSTNAWYKGKIDKVVGKGVFNILFDDGDAQSGVLIDDLVPWEEEFPDGSTTFTNHQKLPAGTSVIAKYKNDDDDVVFFPGKILKFRGMTVGPNQHNSSGRVFKYDIEFMDGEIQTNKPREDLRILDEKPTAGKPKTSENPKPEENKKPKPVSAIKHVIDSKTSDEEKENKSEEGNKTPLYPFDTRIEGNYKGKGKFYPGKITKVHKNGKRFIYDILYDDGDREENVDEGFIRFPALNHRTVSIDAEALAETENPKKRRYTDSPIPSKRKSITPPPPLTPKEPSSDFGSFNEPIEKTGKPIKKSPKSSSKTPEKPTANPDKPNKTQDTLLGIRLEALPRKSKNKNINSAEWQSAVLLREQPDGTVDIKFDLTGEEEKGVSLDRIRATSANQSVTTAVTRKRNSVSEKDLIGFKVGDHVAFNLKGLGKWYSGHIIKARSGGFFDIEYDKNKKEQKIPGEHICLISAIKKELKNAGVYKNMKKRSNSVSSIKIDKVGSKDDFPKNPQVFPIGSEIAVNKQGLGKWFAGVVLKQRKDGSFDVRYEGGEIGYKLPFEHLKLLSSLREELLRSYKNIKSPRSKKPEEVKKPNENGFNPSLDQLSVGKKVYANYRNQGFWLPGRVRKIRADGSVDVMYQMGEIEGKVGLDRVKIDSSKDKIRRSSDGTQVGLPQNPGGTSEKVKNLSPKRKTPEKKPVTLKLSSRDIETLKHMLAAKDKQIEILKKAAEKQKKEKTKTTKTQTSFNINPVQPTEVAPTANPFRNRKERAISAIQQNQIQNQLQNQIQLQNQFQNQFQNPEIMNGRPPTSRGSVSVTGLTPNSTFFENSNYHPSPPKSNRGSVFVGRNHQNPINNEMIMAENYLTQGQPIKRQINTPPTSFAVQQRIAGENYLDQGRNRNNSVRTPPPSFAVSQIKRGSVNPNIEGLMVENYLTQTQPLKRQNTQSPSFAVSQSAPATSTGLNTSPEFSPPISRRFPKLRQSVTPMKNKSPSLLLHNNQNFPIEHFQLEPSNGLDLENGLNFRNGLSESNGFNESNGLDQYGNEMEKLQQELFVLEQEQQQQEQDKIRIIQEMYEKQKLIEEEEERVKFDQNETAALAQAVAAVQGSRSQALLNFSDQDDFENSNFMNPAEMDELRVSNSELKNQLSTVGRKLSVLMDEVGNMRKNEKFMQNQLKAQAMEIIRLNNKKR